MTRKMSARLRQVFVSVSLSAGVLATMNMEMLWQEYNPPARNEVGSVAELQGRNSGKAILDSDDGGLNSALISFQESLVQDELKEQNPFNTLSSSDPLNKVLDKGVLSFRREAFRSPNYQEESGYDLLAYEVTHPDKSISNIVAYLENPGSATQGRGIGAPDERAPFVMFMVAGKGKTAQYFFRNGTLIEHSDLTQGEAQAIVSRRLNTGVPFISVSR